MVKIGTEVLKHSSRPFPVSRPSRQYSKPNVTVQSDKVYLPSSYSVLSPSEIQVRESSYVLTIKITHDGVVVEPTFRYVTIHSKKRMKYRIPQSEGAQIWIKEFIKANGVDVQELLRQHQVFVYAPLFIVKPEFTELLKTLLVCKADVPFKEDQFNKLEEFMKTVPPTTPPEQVEQVWKFYKKL